MDQRYFLGSGVVRLAKKAAVARRLVCFIVRGVHLVSCTDVAREFSAGSRDNDEHFCVLFSPFCAGDTLARVCNSWLGHGGILVSETNLLPYFVYQGALALAFLWKFRWPWWKKGLLTATYVLLTAMQLWNQGQLHSLKHVALALLALPLI